MYIIKLGTYYIILRLIINFVIYICMINILIKVLNMEK